MTSDGDALLSAVGENTWDDTPRLIYADWLEENGQPDRAEYIRLEVAIDERVRQRQKLTSHQVARRRELIALCPEWLNSLPRFPGVAWDNMFDRGFPSRVNTTSASAFLKHAGQIYRHAPVTWVKIRTISAKSAQELPRSPYLARLRGLDLRTCRLGDDGVRLLCTSPHLSRLEVLNLSFVGMGDTGVRAIADCRGLGNLWALHLAGNLFTDAGAVALANSPHFPKLVYLSAHVGSLTVAGQQALARITRKNEAGLPEWADGSDD